MALRKGEATVSFPDVICTRMSDKALLVVINQEEIWIPLSQLSDDSEVFNDSENSEGTLVVSEWIATQKNLA